MDNGDIETTSNLIFLSLPSPIYSIIAKDFSDSWTETSTQFELYQLAFLFFSNAIEFKISKSTKSVKISTGLKLHATFILRVAVIVNCLKDDPSTSFHALMVCASTEL